MTTIKPKSKQSFFDDPNSGVRKLTTKDGKVFDQHGVELSVDDTMGFNYLLRPQGNQYNAEIFAKLTTTDIKFWETRNENDREYLMNLINKDLERLINKLNKFQSIALKKIYAKKSRRLQNSIKRTLEDEESNKINNPLEQV
jgi:geranylgeranyl pyrophosphate synthase